MTELALFGGSKTVDVAEPHYMWPKPTAEMQQAAAQQVLEGVFINRKEGILRKFEENFAHYHGRRYGLTFNTGTSALYAMYASLGLQPGDEVIVPVYTFFASYSPLMQFGVTLVFCDCDENGNILPEAIAEKISPKTKAVVVTHMWGIPCQMDEICSICIQNNVPLLEDCSHAHGATYKGKIVGTFGLIACWSCGGAKTISGGELGILVTNDVALYEAALLWGHYNNRCKEEISSSNPLREFVLTGYGLKLKPSPVAVAIAHQQFSHLAEWLATKQTHADAYLQALGKYPFLRMPNLENVDPSWYAFVFHYQGEVSIDVVEKALYAEGLTALDRPGSTRPTNALPLFTKPNVLFPWLYSNPLVSQESFPNAERYRATAIKLPVWGFPEDKEIVELYIKAMQKVFDAVQFTPEIFG